MKCIYCPIDTRLNFIQVSKLLREVQVRGRGRGPLCHLLPRLCTLLCGRGLDVLTPAPRVLGPVPSRFQTSGLSTLKEVSPLKKKNQKWKEKQA